MRALLILALLAPLPAGAAERIVSADEFAAMVEGRTLRFDRYGEPFGAEQYFEDGRVIWAFEDGACQRGIWFENAEGKICFVYDSEATPQCWDFIEVDGDAFHARAEGAEPEADLVARRFGDEDLDCPLPDLGV